LPELDRAALDAAGAMPGCGTPAACTGPSSPPGDSAATVVATAAAAKTAAATRGCGRRSTLKRIGTLWPPERLTVIAELLHSFSDSVSEKRAKI
jgi:hypothetical protein